MKLHEYVDNSIFGEIFNSLNFGNYETKTNENLEKSYIIKLPSVLTYDKMQEIFGGNGDAIKSYDSKVNVVSNDELNGNLGYRIDCDSSNDYRISLARDNKGIQRTADERFATYLHELFPNHDTAQLYARKLSEELTNFDSRYQSVLDEVISEGKRVGLAV